MVKARRDHAVSGPRRLTRSPSLVFGECGLIVGAAGPEAARVALAVGDFLAVDQRVAVFDLLGMVAAAVRARWHPSPDEVHVPNGMRGRCAW